MTEEKIQVLHTVGDKVFPSEDYLEALKKMEKLSEEYKESQKQEGREQENKESRARKTSIIYADWHKVFKKRCLAPFPKKGDKKTVFVK